jgi:hypothetical protein
MWQIGESDEMAWKTERHLTDHFRDHRHEFPGFTIEDYDRSAHETMASFPGFNYVDMRTGDDRIGAFDPETGRFTGTTTDDLIVTHHVTSLDHVLRLLYNDYRDHVRE